MAKIAKKSASPLSVVNPDAAGIDVSATMHMVAIPPNRGPEPIRQFGAFTEDLHELAEWLVQHQIRTVAMESTGVYWKQLFHILRGYGFEVLLVNARHTKNVSGRKTDETDAAWIQKLHSCGLLSSCFLPEDQTESLRSLVRQRKSLIEDGTRYVLRMQKAMEVMNIKIHSVISDILGKTGRAIVEAIIGGERDPQNLLGYVDSRIQADQPTLLKSLSGNWRKEQLFLLEQNYRLYQDIQKHIDVCDKEIKKLLEQQVEANNHQQDVNTSKRPVKKRNKNTPSFAVEPYLNVIHGVDVTAIYGISSGAALQLLAETGTDMTRWPTEKHFVSWLNLCPNNKITGGKLISSMLLKKQPNAASQAFRAAANTVQRSDHYLGDYFRRKKAKGGNKYAIVATAAKIATIYYLMLKEKKEFIPIDKEIYREQFRAKKIAYLEKRLAKIKASREVI